MATEYKYIEMIGRLAKDKEYKISKDDPKTAVFINNNKDIQYYVKSLSINNEVKEEMFTGYIDSIKNIDFVDDIYGDDDERINAFTKHYSQSLFVFSHKIDMARNCKVDIADVVPLPSKVKETDKFVAIPFFSGKSDCDIVGRFSLFREYDNYLTFKQFLMDGKAIGRIYNFKVNASACFPEFIVWKDEERMVAIGPIQSAEYINTVELVLKTNADNLVELDLDDERDDTLEYVTQSESNPTLIHITESKYLEIVNKMKSHEEKVVEKESQIKSSEEMIKEESILEEVRTLPTEKTEEEILEFFRYHSQKKKLFYAPKDIVNFHTAIKTGSLVILSGMSGTGKSALIDTYAKALGVEKNVLMIPVRPSWNDDSDLLGYVDLIHMVYRPSDTGFIDKIVEASMDENKNKLYLICLDEMNLARVEHYFSQFLSILEKPSGSRELILYDEQYSGQLYNHNKYPQTVSIGDNVKFIGTVNIDESTYHFSDKVLDRANVITLEILNYSQPNSWKEDKYQAANTPEWSSEDFNKLIKREDVSVENQDRIREFLWKMHLLLNETNANLGVGPRIVKSIEMYLRNLPKGTQDFLLSANEGFDYQVAQRILTKVRGPEEQLKELFNKKDSGYCYLEELLNEFSDLSVFERSRKSIMQKEKELRVYGYCL